MFHISIDVKQVKQQLYSEKGYPIKSFTVPSQTCTVRLTIKFQIALLHSVKPPSP